jgi:hypothetical protein
MAEPIDEEGVVETAVDLLGDEDSLGEVVNFRGEALGDGNNTPTKTSVGPATVEENEPQHAKANKGPELPVLLDEDVESVVSSNGTTPRPPPKKPFHLYRERITSVDNGTFAVVNRFRDPNSLPLQKMIDIPYQGLHAAARDGNTAAIKKMLNQVGGAVHVDLRTKKQFYCRTPLHVACMCGKQEAVETLLRYKANIDAQDNWGWTPVMYCAEYGHVAMVKYCVGRGCNLSIRNNADQFLIDVVRAKRDEFEWKDDLADFIYRTECDLVSQSLADGWEVFFGKIYHFTRPKRRYRKATLTLPLRGTAIELVHRVGDFGLQFCTRRYPLEHVTQESKRPAEQRKNVIPNTLMFTENHVEIHLHEAENYDEANVVDDITKTDLWEHIAVDLKVPPQLDPSWIVRYFQERKANVATLRVELAAALRRKNSKWSKLRRYISTARALPYEFKPVGTAAKPPSLLTRILSALPRRKKKPASVADLASALSATEQKKRVARFGGLARMVVKDTPAEDG